MKGVKARSSCRVSRLYFTAKVQTALLHRVSCDLFATCRSPRALARTKPIRARTSPIGSSALTQQRVRSPRTCRCHLSVAITTTAHTQVSAGTFLHQLPVQCTHSYQNLARRGQSARSAVPPSSGSTSRVLLTFAPTFSCAVAGRTATVSATASFQRQPPP